MMQNKQAQLILPLGQRTTELYNEVQVLPPLKPFLNK